MMGALPPPRPGGASPRDIYETEKQGPVKVNGSGFFVS